MASDCERCPSCHFDIRGFYANSDFVDKLIAALNHPEPTTPIRAASILGHRREPGAVMPLYNLATRTPDRFVRVAAIKALLAIATPDALRLAEKCLENLAPVERRLVLKDHPDEKRDGDSKPTDAK